MRRDKASGLLTELDKFRAMALRALAQKLFRTLARVMPHCGMTLASVRNSFWARALSAIARNLSSSVSSPDALSLRMSSDGLILYCYKTQYKDCINVGSPARKAPIWAVS